MEQNLTEIRNLQIINMKRLNRIEKLYQDLLDQSLDNKYLLELVKDSQIKSNNQNDEFLNLDRFGDVFQADIQDLNNIFVDKESNMDLNEEIIIPRDFFSRN